jgi:putative ABC transport system ATP-binding protein
MMIGLQGVTKTYDGAAGSFQALRGIDLCIDAGEFVAIVGKSGGGKSTLLNMIGGIDRPSSGSVVIGGTSIHALDPNAAARWRGRTVGFVFQFFQLIPSLTVAENVMLPMDFLGALSARQRDARALELLARVGCDDQAGKLPSALSGGQQQRVAIARALANDPPLLIADEPTGNLDSQTGSEIFQLFGQLSATGKTVVLVTHQRDAAAVMQRTITIRDGCIVGDDGGPAGRDSFDQDGGAILR